MLRRIECSAMGCLLAIILGGPVRPVAADHADDETAAVRSAAKSYIEAFHRGDMVTLSKAWTEKGDFVDSQGQHIRGREWVTKFNTQEHGSAPVAEITIESIRLIQPDVALEDGAISASPHDRSAQLSRYTAIWVKREGKWLLDSVRTSAPASESPHAERLRPLAWLVGNWEARGADGVATVRCQPSEDGNYLLREIKITRPDGNTQNVSQRIGWDAARKQIRSWTFDSDGGHAVGVWTPQADQWVVHSEGVLPDGQVTASVSNYSHVDDNAFKWEIRHLSRNGGTQASHQLTFKRSTRAK